MVLVERVAQGAEKWDCPDCEHQLLIYWRPTFRRVVLRAGDQMARHSGAKGGVVLGTVSAMSSPSGAAKGWLRDSGIEWDALGETKPN
jgi:ribosomal protein S27E